MIAFPPEAVLYFLRSFYFALSTGELSRSAGGQTVSSKKGK